MKRLIRLFVLSCAFVVLTANQIIAQSTSQANAGGGARPTQEQSLHELVNEVRQLRTMLQRINLTVYKTNVVVERLKFQQDVVYRLSRELNDVRDNLGDIRSQITKMKEIMPRIETAVQTGAKDPDELKAMKLELDSVAERETRLLQRETQLVNELSTERSKLLELNEQLNKIEVELTQR